MTKQWFDVSRDGLGKQAEQHSKGRLIGELVQNALDEAGVTQIDVTLALVPGRPLADLTVADDSPEGFRHLAHAYTLFAESYKRTNPEQRGCFNFGEKLVLSVCESASLTTTKGTVIFDANEGRIEKPRQKRDRGSVFQGRIKVAAAFHGHLHQPQLKDGVSIESKGLPKNRWSGFLPDDRRFILVNEETPDQTEYLTVGFGDRTDIPVADFEAAQRHGWKVASPDAYPCFFQKKGHVLGRPLPWHLDLVEAWLRAVPRFVAGSRRYWRGRVAVASGRLSLWVGRGF